MNNTNLGGSTPITKNLTPRQQRLQDATIKRLEMMKAETEAHAEYRARVFKLKGSVLAVKRALL